MRLVKTKQMAEEIEKTGEEIQDRIEQIEEYVQENQKMVLGVAGTVLVIIFAAVYVFAKWLPDENLKAQKAIFMAEFAFAKDSFAVALNGNAGYKGFADVASKYSWTKTGNLANYYAGVCCLNLKKYDESIKYLDKFSTNDAILGALKLSATGDAYSETGKFDDAIKYYEKAANFSDNESYTPYFLFKTGLAYEKAKKYADAKKYYEQVRDKYPASEEGRDIEKYIARASAGAI